MVFVDRFEIDIISALTAQLLKAFEQLTPTSLAEQSLADTPSAQGVYRLFHRGNLVYVGKADNLGKRLRDHLRKIGGRLNIDVSDMTFDCLEIHPNWTALAPEEALIAHYKSAHVNQCEWNGNSFGPHDPGRDRETTNKPASGFDSQYPIRSDLIVDWIEPRAWNGRELLMAFKQGLPYLLRYQVTNNNAWQRGHPDYNNATIAIQTPNMTARDLLAYIARQLPGWQATAFVSHMILYKESKQYTHGQTL